MFDFPSNHYFKKIDSNRTTPFKFESTVDLYQINKDWLFAKGIYLFFFILALMTYIIFDPLINYHLKNLY